MKYDNFFVNEEPFFDHEMITSYIKTTGDINQMLIKGMFKTSLKVGYMIEEERLKKWIERCIKLDNISENTVNDIAIEKKFRQLKNEIDYLKNRPNTKWQKLEKWLTDKHNNDNDNSLLYTEILIKMQELEGEDE